MPTDNAGTGGLRLNVDTTIMNITPWNPNSAWIPGLYGPFWTELMGEAKYVGSDVPTTTFASVQVQKANLAFTSTLPVRYNVCPWPVRYLKTAFPANSFAIQTSGASGALNSPC